MERTRFATAAVLLGWIGLFSSCSSPPPAPAPKDQPVAPKPITAEERVKWYQDCWEDFNQKKWTEFQQCYAPTATSQDGMGRTLHGPDAIAADSENFAKGVPDVRGDGQLILVNGTHTAGVYLLTGTHSGPLKSPEGKETPATNKKFGLLFGHTLEVEPNAPKGTKEFGVMDNGTFVNQLGLSKNPGRPLMEKGVPAPKIVIAKNDAAETKNLDAEKATADAWNKRDATTLYPFYADDVVVHDMTQPKDQTKAQMQQSDKDLWKAFSDARITNSSIWAAGDYAVINGTFEGTNDGDFAPMKLKKTGKKVSVPYLSIDRLEDGKIKESWLFFDGAYFAAQLGVK